MMGTPRRGCGVPSRKWIISVVELNDQDNTSAFFLATFLNDCTYPGFRLVSKARREPANFAPLHIPEEVVISTDPGVECRMCPKFCARSGVSVWPLMMSAKPGVSAPAEGLVQGRSQDFRLGGGQAPRGPRVPPSKIKN